MCGIFGYIGKNEACNEVFDGLKKLEYRGYDSCGIACIKNNKIWTTKRIGAPSELADVKLYKSNISIGHTRWATHGTVILKNAHPHLSQNKKISIAHNGIIENYIQVKEELEEKGYKFKTHTDTEVLANLIQYYYEDHTFVDAVKLSLNEITGTFGIAVMCTDHPNMLIGARRSSPLIIGIGLDKFYITSDIIALPDDIKNVVYLDDDQLIVLEDGEFDVCELGDKKDKRIYKKIIKPRKNNLNLGDYSCYMEKEIYEQPVSIRNCLRGRLADKFTAIRFGGIENIKKIKRVLIVACGTAYHAGLVGKQYIEQISKLPVRIEIASEFNPKHFPIEKNTLAIAISQSGETFDTINAVKSLKECGVKTIAITNTVSSTLSRIVDAGIYQYAGAEVSVASTKAFTSQATILLMLAIHFAKLSKNESKKYIQQLRKLPNLIERCLENREKIKKIAGLYQMIPTCNFLGRQNLYPIALEGSLKLKEVTYIHCHGYPAGELKHGPLATITRGTTSLYLATLPELQDRDALTMEEIKSRQGGIVVVKQERQEFPQKCYNQVINIPNCPTELIPILSVIPLQLFSMFIAQFKKLNVDKPRNLAKSVTVQ